MKENRLKKENRDIVHNDSECFREIRGDVNKIRDDMPMCRKTSGEKR